MSVHIYTFRIFIDGEAYCGQLPAASWEAAEKLVKRLGGVLEGQLIEQQTLCAVCAEILVEDMSRPEPCVAEEEWPEEVA